MSLVEAFEACAALRLAIPEIQPWFDRVRADNFERRLPVSGLARLLAATARLGVIDKHGVGSILQRIVTVASPMRPPSLDVIATICQGLFLAKWSPRGHELWQVVS